MADSSTAPTPPAARTETLGGGTYEVIRQRLQAQGGVLRERLARLDARRREVFGAIEYRLLQADRITTSHNCIPRDMVQLDGSRFLFGFNVRFGLKKESELGDVFAIYERDLATGGFRERGLEVLSERTFIADFKRLYQVYDKATFAKFSLLGNHLYMVFQIGAGLHDIAVFKWVYHGGLLRYVDGRSEAEFRKAAYPPPHEFRWLTPDREAFRYGAHPHVSIADRVFVECIGGDLTIKVEDNTATGEGIHAEPVDDKYQKVDDAEIAYALVGDLVILRIRPYKETRVRCFVYHAKQQTVVRVDSIAQSCGLLPEEHGLVFPDGYYLATGELKLFENSVAGLVRERVVSAPNGEDTLFVFSAPESGHYVLMPYRLIAQTIEERITCHGFSLFPDGHLLLFRAEPEPQKHHQVQLRQTPFHQVGHEPPGQREAYLYQVGNKEVVRALAEGHEVLVLAARDQPYAALYTDLVGRCNAIVDTYPWLARPDGFEVAAALRDVGATADQAVDEFDKVRRLQREAARRVELVRARCEECFGRLRRTGFRNLSEFVHELGALRQLRGEVIAAREVRYVDPAQLVASEKALQIETTQLAQACVAFLLQPAALAPYREAAEKQLAAIAGITRVSEGRKLEAAAQAAGGELELLIETVNSLRIEDATEATRIIDSVTAIYATLNQVRAALKKHLQALIATEGAAQFAAQLKLLNQSASGYLDLCDTPDRCDEYVNRLTVQLEELEAAFADFEEYTVPLAEKRASLQEAFEQRKVALVEQRSRKASALLAAADRIVQVITHRLGACTTLDAIHAYAATDPMVARVRALIDQLLALGDPVKADELQGRLKSVQQDAVRQLRDRQDLFIDGSSIIQLGGHRFNVNTQPLDLTVVVREGVPHLHLTSTRYFEPVTDATLLAARELWEREVVSEGPEAYRGEYLAWQLLQSLPAADLPALVALDDAALLVRVQEFAQPRHTEGYVRGIHDVDTAQILRVLTATHLELRLARHAPSVRACAVVYWHRFCPPATRTLWTVKLAGFGLRNRLFPGDPVQAQYASALRGLIKDFNQQTGLFPVDLADAAGDYLFAELVGGEAFVVSREADELVTALTRQLAARGGEDGFRQTRAELVDHPASEFELVRDWVRGFLIATPQSAGHADEAAALLFLGEEFRRAVVSATTTRTLTGMKGAHPLIAGSTYQFNYLDLQDRLKRFTRDAVPRFTQWQQRKQEVLDQERTRLRLEEFKPRVLTSFVRNQLIDRVYLPLVGENLAKQIGIAGDQKRTDLMGLLLLISPPGYGKTTLLEYVASRLGIVFVKINGPALGHGVTSLDPEEAPNAAAREEIQKLNLALEMGDNVMLCVDDIQHCNPEFLQKFISLCDAQRKIEGVWRGHTRTHDLRGRKIVVAMAGNPYTESGLRFKLPDMLANRADTYNLGDIIGGSAEWFRASYVENALTANPVLAPLAQQDRGDVRQFLELAAANPPPTGSFAGTYSQAEVDEIVAVLRHLITIRDVVLRVNQEYIHSAGQSDDYRTEPAFRLQGSYRNMNRLAAKVVPIMTDTEIRGLILDHYRGESQTLTTGAEANLLKFKELLGIQSPEEVARWSEIKVAFRRQQVMRGGDPADPVGRVVGQLAEFQTGLGAIRETLEHQLSRAPAPLTVDLKPLERAVESLRETLTRPVASAPGTTVDRDHDSGVAQALTVGLRALREDLGRALTVGSASQLSTRVDSLSHELEMIHSTLATLKDVAARQRDHLRNATELLAARAKQGTVEIELTQEMLTNERAFLDRFHEVLAASQRPTDQPTETPNSPTQPQTQAPS